MPRVTDTRERLTEAALLLVWEGNLASASVDAICAKAGVRKGSFYHFFKTKTDLILAAFADYAAGMRPDFDRIFSASRPPVERLREFFVFMARKMAERRDKAGRVLGCLCTSVGASCSPEDEAVRVKAQEILAGFRRYLEAAVRDGQQDGSIPVKDVQASTDALFQYIEGVKATARAQNDLKPIEQAGRGAFAILGLQWQAPAEVVKT
jgi:TetR/AcrR family transcriptional regulator, transcriptional repressor for nem operon